MRIPIAFADFVKRLKFWHIEKGRMLKNALWGVSVWRDPSIIQINNLRLTLRAPALFFSISPFTQLF